MIEYILKRYVIEILISKVILLLLGLTLLVIFLIGCRNNADSYDNEIYGTWISQDLKYEVFFSYWNKLGSEDYKVGYFDSLEENKTVIFDWWWEEGNTIMTSLCNESFEHCYLKFSNIDIQYDRFFCDLEYEYLLIDNVEFLRR